MINTARTIKTINDVGKKIPTFSFSSLFHYTVRIFFWQNFFLVKDNEKVNDHFILYHGRHSTRSWAMLVSGSGMTVHRHSPLARERLSIFKEDINNLMSSLDKKILMSKI